MMKDLFEVRDEILIVHLPDELDHHTAEEIKKSTDDLFARKRIRDIIFDYSDTNFMDSSGIGLIMGRYREVRYLKGNVYLVNISGKMERVLSISGLYRVAKKKDTIDNAIEDINNCSGRISHSLRDS